MKEKTMIGSIVAGGMVLCGCSLADQQTGNTPAAPDYSTDSAWLAKADSLDKPVDVFYVYPTIYAGLDPKKGNVLHRYYSKMTHTLREAFRVLKPGKAAIFVVGSSVMRGIDTQTDTCLAEIG